MSSDTQTWRRQGPLELELGGRLVDVDVAYRTWGELGPGRDNAVIVCHALTGSASADEWWGGMFGDGMAFDPSSDFIVSSNVLGSCYGTTGPSSINPQTGLAYGPSFPTVTVRDMVRIQIDLANALGIRSVRMVIGGSLGGMQALEWAIMAPNFVRSIVPIATTARHSAWSIALSEAQRAAIFADPKWDDGRYPDWDGPSAGMAAARMMAMCTYRTRESFERRFSRNLQVDGGDLFSIQSYLRHQGQKIVERFSARTYVALIRAMDSHDLGRGRGGVSAALAGIRVPSLVVSIPGDVLYPPMEQGELTQGIAGAETFDLISDEGHDAFLIDTTELSNAVCGFLQRHGL